MNLLLVFFCLFLTHTAMYSAVAVCSTRRGDFSDCTDRNKLMVTLLSVASPSPDRTLRYVFKISSDKVFLVV